MTPYQGLGKGWRKTVTHCPRGHYYTGHKVKRKRRRGDTSVTYVFRACTVCRRMTRRPGIGCGYRRFETHCPKGHPYEGANLGLQTLRTGGTERETRMCRECKRKRQREWCAAKRALEARQ